MIDPETPTAITLKVSTHKKGTPFPEMIFDEQACNYGKMYTSYACFSNEDIKRKLTEHYEKYPKANECVYFWYEMYKEPIKEQQ
jgi:hypothetical protein